MIFGISLWVCVAMGASLLIGLMLGYSFRTDQLPPVTQLTKLKLKKGYYRCRSSSLISGRLLGGRAVDSAYHTILQGPTGKLGQYLFKGECPKHFVVGNDGISVCEFAHG